MKVTYQQPDSGVTIFLFIPKRLLVGKQFKILTCSDIHIDSDNCNRELLKKHCEEADYIRIIGDLFDLMQGKNDKRRSYSDLKDKYKSTNYIDEVIKDAAEFFKPYAKKLIFVGLGNHETSVISNVGTNPISAFCMLMRMHGSMVVEGTYQGYIVDTLKKPNSGGNTNNVITAFHHGHGGAPQKTEGTLEMEADKAKYPNADIIVKGHNHFKWHNPGQTRYWLNKAYKIEKRVQHHVRLGTYKESKFTDGWEVEKGFKPTPLGSYFITYITYRVGESTKLKFEITEAN
jgi:predicted phosphodiesterase